MHVESRFTNAEDRPLEIESVRSSCGCTIVDSSAYAGRRVLPGESVPVEAKLRTETNPGPKRRTLILETTDGGNYEVHISVEVYGTWALDRYEVDFGEVAVDRLPGPRSAVVTYTSESDQLIAVDAPSVPWLDVQTNIADSKLGATILVRAISGAVPLGRASTSVAVRTDNPLKPAAVIFVRTDGVEDLQVMPRPLTLLGRNHSPYDSSIEAAAQ